MTPAINFAKKHHIEYQLHEYTHDATVASYGLEAAEKLGVNANQVFKTLVIASDTGILAVAILPVASSLNFKKTAKALGYKKVKMADPKHVERSTGYVLGGVSPLGQKKPLATIIDISAKEQSTIYVSAGRRGLELQLPPQQLADALKATFFDITDD